MKPVIRRTLQSLSDLDEIWAYIARDSEFQADRWIRKIEERIQQLACNNGAGHPRPELATGMRCSNLKDHVVFYRPLGETGVEVVRVLHSSRDIQPDFFE